MPKYTATGTLMLGSDTSEFVMNYESVEGDELEKFVRLIMRDNSPALRVDGLAIVPDPEPQPVFIAKTWGGMEMDENGVIKRAYTHVDRK